MAPRFFFFHGAVCTETAPRRRLFRRPRLAVGASQWGGGLVGGGSEGGAGYWHGRWQQQQAGAPHATPALINISPRPTSPIALAQYLIFKITDDKKFIEIEHKVRVRVRVRVREPTLP